MIGKLFGKKRDAKIEEQLKREAEMFAQIDPETGLFSKTQSDIKLNADSKPNSAIFVFKLNFNDAENINKELKKSFAKIIVEGVRIHVIPPFIGRYNDDEFIVYHENVTEDDLNLYTKEINFLTEQFNEKESSYQISFKSGKASKVESANTVRNLFDIAYQSLS